MAMGLDCCAAKLRFLLEGVMLLGREPGALSRSTEPRTDQTLLASIVASASVVGIHKGHEGVGESEWLSTQTTTMASALIPWI